MKCSLFLVVVFLFGFVEVTVELLDEGSTSSSLGTGYLRLGWTGYPLTLTWITPLSFILFENWIFLALGYLAYLLGLVLQ